MQNENPQKLEINGKFVGNNENYKLVVNGKINKTLWKFIKTMFLPP